MGSNEEKQLAAGVLGGLVGIGVAVNPLLGLIKGFAIGYGVGSTLFPIVPEVEDQEFDELDSVDETRPVPVVFGTRRIQGKIVYFDPKQIRTIKQGESVHYFGPMQVALCMSEVPIPVSQTVFPEGFQGIDLSGYAPSQTANGVNAPGFYLLHKYYKILDPSTGEDWLSVPYFIAQNSWSLWEQVNQAVGLAAIQGILSGNTAPVGGWDGFGADPKTISDPLGIEYYTKSWPIASPGGEVFDWATIHNGTAWAPNHEYFAWDPELPPLKGVFTLASPVWYLGDTVVGTAPRLEYEVGAIYSSLPKDVITEVFTNTIWGARLSSSLLSTDSIEDNAYITHIQQEGLTLNAVLDTRQSLLSFLEEVNFHLGTILRADLQGRLELLPLRSIADYNYSKQDYVDWIEAGMPEGASATIYFPGFPVVFDVYDEDPSDLAISNELWDTTINELVVQFPDASADFKEGSFRLKNEANYEITQTWRTEVVSFDMFTDLDSCLVRGEQILREKSRPGAILTCKLPKRYNLLRVGDGLRVWSSKHGLEGVYFRVMRRREGVIGSASLEVEAILDKESLYADEYTKFSINVDGLSTAPESQDDPSDPKAVHVFTHHWPSNCAFVDDDAPHGANDPLGLFKTHAMVAKGNGNQIGYRIAVSEGPLNPLLGPQIPATAKGIVKDTTFSAKLTNLIPLVQDEFRYAFTKAEGGIPLYCQIQGYNGQDLTDEVWFTEKTDEELETDPWVLVFLGRPADLADGIDFDEHPTIEIIRFGRVTKLDNQIYQFERLSRSANKEQALHWPPGSEVWVTKLQDFTFPGTYDYGLWPYRNLLREYAKSLSDNGFWRVRAYAQSITVDPDFIEGSETEQPETEGVTRTLDHINSGFYAKATGYLGDGTDMLPPMSAVTSLRIGYLDGEGLWWDPYIDGEDTVNLLSTSQQDYTTWTALGAGATVTANAWYPPFVIHDQTAHSISGTLFSQGRETTVSGLSGGGNIDYLFAIPLRPSQSSTQGTTNASALEIRTNDNLSITNVVIDWHETNNFGGLGPNSQCYGPNAAPSIAANPFLPFTGTGNFFGSEYIGNGYWLIWVGFQKPNAQDIIRIRIYPTSSAGSATTTIYAGKPFLEQASEPTYYRRGDYLVMFAPHADADMVGDASNTGNNKDASWATFDEDTDETDFSLSPNTSISGVFGTYSLSMRAEVYKGNPATSAWTPSGFFNPKQFEMFTDTVTISSGSRWPCFYVRESDMPNFEDPPSAFNKFGPCQVRPYVAKETTSSALNTARPAAMLGPWPENHYDNVLNPLVG